jgi:hypothetical protein
LILRILDLSLQFRGIEALHSCCFHILYPTFASSPGTTRATNLVGTEIFIAASRIASVAV